MKKLYYISILASFMASQSNFAAEDQEEKFLLAFEQIVTEKKGKLATFIRNLFFISNKVKGNDIKITDNTNICYFEKDQRFFKKIDMSNKDEIFGNIFDFDNANPATIFKKDEIIPFIQHFIDSKEDDLLNDPEVDEVYKDTFTIHFITLHPIKIISKTDQGALTEDLFKERNTPTQKPLNQELNPPKETNPSTESLWSGYQKPILTIIALAVLLGILYYIEVFSTLLSNDKK